MPSDLAEFIQSIYEEITNITGEFKDFSMGSADISDCDVIIDNIQNKPLIAIDNGANAFKKVANVVMHIFYASPLKTPIFSDSPIAQFINPNFAELKNLKDTDNHQNALIAIAYGLFLLNQEKTFTQSIYFSCHSLVELIQTMCRMELDNMDNLLSSTHYLSLLFEQATYKCNADIEYQPCALP